VSDSRLGKRYAEALYRAAVDKNNVDAVMEAMSALKASFDRSPEIIRFWYGPRAPVHEKQKVIEEALKNAPDTVRNLLAFLLEKQRQDLLFDIITALAQIHDQAQGIVRATLVTAISLQENEVKPFEQILSKQVGGKILLNCTVDKELIGGFRLRFGDRIIDASVVRSIEALRQQACS